MGNNPSDFYFEVGNIPAMSEIWKDRIRKALEAKGMTMKEASLAAGKGETFVRDMLERGRAPSVDNFISIAHIVGKPASYLLGEDEGEPSAPAVRRVMVAAHIQAGVWTEAWEWSDGDQYPVYVPNDPALQSFRLHAAETRGPSMNRRYPEGTVLVFTDVNETMEDPIPGKRYIVERRRPGGETEHTVKLLHIDDEGRYWLVPESADPRFQAPIPVDEGTGDGDTVAIIGRVCYSVSKE